jgi:hypothetical protein
MNPSITAAKIAAFSSDAMFSAVRAVLLAETLLAHRKALVAPLQQQCIAEVPLYADLSDGQPITTMANAYLCTDEAALAKLYDLYKTKLRAAGGCGLSDADIEKGYCPELVADQLLIQAQNALIDLVGDIVGLSRTALDLKQRKRVIELTLAQVVAHPNFRCELPKPGDAG